MPTHHMPDTNSAAKLIKALEQVESAAVIEADCYTSRLPKVEGVGPKEQAQIAHRLTQAVADAIPAKVHAHVNHFDEVDITIIDADHAEVWSGDGYVRIPRDQLSAYWVDEGHRIA